MLQEFLTRQFINIAEDENLAKLNKASSDVVKILEKKRSKIISYTLVAFDPQVSVENPDIIEVSGIISRHWRTFVSNAKDTPVTYVRAVMLDALKRIAKHIDFACLIWLTGRNVIRYYKLGREKDLLGDFLLNLGETIETEAINEWTLTNPSIDFDTDEFNFQIEKIPAATIDKETLRKKIEDAVGPQNKQGTSNYESPNPHFPNQGPAWSYEFAPRATNGIADAVKKALNDQGTIINNNQSQLEELIDSLIKLFKSALNKVQRETLEKNAHLHTRTQLLWWKEASYSAILKENYRKLDIGLLHIIIALDYANIVPYLYPISADYFLQETIRNLTDSDEKKHELSELLSLIGKYKGQLQYVFKEYAVEPSRISL